MVIPMTTSDERTDVLKSLVSKPVKAGDIPTITRELANVVISMSADVFVLTRIVRGEDGGNQGLVNQVRDIKDDVVEILAKMAALQKTTDEVKAAAAEAKTSSPFTRTVFWLVDRVLPSLLAAGIAFLIALGFAAYLHLKIVQEVP